MKKSQKNASKQLIALLKKNRLTLSLAESCTGGLLSSFLTRHAGVSDVFLGGVVTYSDHAKINILEVDRRAIKKFGAVSLPVAEQMCLGAMKKFESGIALSITGIAGPSGGSKLKPVGTVCFGVHTGSETILQQMKFSGSRTEIQTQSAIHGIELLIDTLRTFRKSSASKF
jgi:PncC family amidohydrolase